MVKYYIDLFKTISYLPSMQELKILNTREKKPYLAKIKEQWGCDFSTDLVWMVSKKDKLFLIKPSIASIDLTQLRIDSMGLYFGTINKGELRLSIEGSQMIGPIAKKNIVDLSKEEMHHWLHGEDLEKETESIGYVILKHEKDYLGCGRIVGKKILNFIPKSRRIH